MGDAKVDGLHLYLGLEPDVFFLEVLLGFDGLKILIFELLELFSETRGLMLSIELSIGAGKTLKSVVNIIQTFLEIFNSF